MKKFPNPVSSSKCHENQDGPLKSFPKIYPRRKMKETADVGRGCVFGDPLPIV